MHRRLRRLGRPALLVHEPGSTPLGETVRDWVKTDPGLTLSAELFLFAAARSQLVEQVIRPGLEDGVTVIADRLQPPLSPTRDVAEGWILASLSRSIARPRAD